MMNIVRIASLAPVLLLTLGAPSIAATRPWPLLISQPVTATNISASTPTIVTVLCGISLSGKVYESEAPITPTLSGGVLTFNGTVPVTINPAAGSAPRAPETGDAVSCQLRQKINGAWTNLGTLSTTKIP
jgi:hypothetical protein